jgi:hypothetical protein
MPAVEQLESKWVQEVARHKLTARGEALHFASTHRGIRETRPNFDNRPNARDPRWGIAKAQYYTAGGAHWLDGTPWCGEWLDLIFRHAKVQNLSSRLASVALIEDDARRGHGPFTHWLEPSEWKHAERGDAVVMFGRGIHVELLRQFVHRSDGTYAVNDGGNTSPPGGNQSEGIGTFRKFRPIHQIHGIAHVDYGRLGPGLVQGFDLDPDANIDWESVPIDGVDDPGHMPPSDELLIHALQQKTDPQALTFAGLVGAALLR